MGDTFKPIMTQEELDAVIKDRLERKEKQLAEKLADHDAIAKERDTLLKEKAGYAKSMEDQKKAAESLQKQLDEANSKKAEFEKDAIRTRVAIKTGLPMELRDRLKGADEKEIEADAQEMVKMIGAGSKSHKTPPLKSTEEGGGAGSDHNAALLETLRSIKGE